MIDEDHIHNKELMRTANRKQFYLRKSAPGGETRRDRIKDRVFLPSASNIFGISKCFSATSKAKFKLCNGSS